MAKAKPKAKKYTEAADDRADKRAGIKENTPKDKALDAKRGVPEMLMVKMGKPFGKATKR